MTATLCSATLAVPEAHVKLPSPASNDASPQRSPSAAANQYVPMTRPLILSALLISIGTLGLGAERPSKPNIVIMMADDMGMGDTSAYLGKTLGPNARPIAKTLRTPHLEAFARNAMVFTDAYAPASMCSSTRYSLLTGRFAHRAYLKKQGWLPHGPNPPMIQRGCPTLPEMLRGNGYTTAGIGKYHVGIALQDSYGAIADEHDFSDVDFSKPFVDGPIHHGFDEYFGVTGNTEDPLDFEPRNYLRNGGWAFRDGSRMIRIGMGNRAGRVLAAPDWDLTRLGADYLQEAQAFLDRQSRKRKPFFLYYVPNANHYQRHPGGDYAVPEHIAGHPVRGQSRYSDGTPAGPREDMILENDLAFGEILRALRDTDDPRWPGHKLIDNTLIIFTSDNGPNVGDNLRTNQESGGLRSKKAKIWEGGIRVPFLAYWKARIEGGGINRQVCSLTDLYATLATLVGHALTPFEAHDSHDCLDWWLGAARGRDERPRVFFCHLGPPFSNDVLAIRKGADKVLVDGGLALPTARNGSRGASVPIAFYDLTANPYEDGEGIPESHAERAAELASELLRIHNRGHARDLRLEDEAALILDDGWHNLRNDLNGFVGFEFRLREDRAVTHLGLWDDHHKDAPARPARNVPTAFDRDHPGLDGGKRGVIRAPHTICLQEVLQSGLPRTLAELEMPAGNPGEWENEFRYLALPAPTCLKEGRVYRLTMSTSAGDGDHFRDPVAFDGLSPQIHPSVEIIRSVLVRGTKASAIPGTGDMNASYSAHRLPVGPTLRFEKMAR